MILIKQLYYLQLINLNFDLKKTTYDMPKIAENRTALQILMQVALIEFKKTISPMILDLIPGRRQTCLSTNI
jgi:hypothetical protein